MIELAIDMGAMTTTIATKETGVVVKEASVAIVAREKKKLVLVECGNKAVKILAEGDKVNQVVKPFKEGVVTNEEVAVLLLANLINKIEPKRFLRPKIRARVLISLGLSIVEMRKIENVVRQAGVDDVILEEAPLSLLRYVDREGGLFVDIGASTTEIATVNSEGIIVGYSVAIGGNVLNNLFIDYVTNVYGIKIGRFTAEKYKTSVGGMYNNDNRIAELTGKDIVTGSIKTVAATALDVAQSFSPAIDNIISVIEAVLNMTPKQLAEDIMSKGMYLSGGTALLPGIEDYIANKIKTKVIVLDEITNAIALGVFK